MTRVSRSHRLTSDQLTELRSPRRDLLIETRSGPDEWTIADGPFREYRRRLDVVEQRDGSWSVDETIEFRLALPLWGPLFVPMVKRDLASLDRRPRSRWWWPSSEIVTERSATLISVVAIISIVAGYLGVIISQTLTFASTEFGADNAAQGRTFAAVRIGIVASIVFIRQADRIGRRPLLIGFTVASILFTAVGALSPNLLALGVSQAIARGFATGLLTLIALAVTEEVPAGARSLSIGLVTMATGFGAFLVIAVLPVADLSVTAWRFVYVVPLVFLPVMWWAWRRLPETRRFSVADKADAPAIVDRRRFIILAVSAFFTTIFFSPASQFLNEYLRDELDFSASRISVFRTLVNVPVALFILGAGFLADRVGRKPIGSIGIVFGAIGSAMTFFAGGALLWIAAMIGSWMSAGAYAAMRSYQTELFPTRARARVGGWIDVVTVSGSAVGLLIVGELAVRWGSLGPGLSLMLVGPVIVVAVLLLYFPETASTELEAFNPDDPDPGLPAWRSTI